MTNATELAWAAGFITAKGSFMVRTYKGRGDRPDRLYAQLTIALEPKYEGDLQRIATATGIPCWPNTESVRGRPPKVSLKVQGKTLDDMMDLLWDYLPPHRQQDYRSVRRTAKPTRAGAIISCAHIPKGIYVHHE